MTAVVCERLDGIEALTLRHEHPEPVPTPGHVVVAVEAAALNFPDLLMLTGAYQHKPDLPFVPGMEGAGVIIGTSGVDREHRGRRVMFNARGTLATQTRVPLEACIDFAAHWTMAEAAAFPVAAMTAYHALVTRGTVTRGDVVLVNGATGGVGHMAAKLAKLLGARVIATGGDAAKLEVVRGFGADAVVLTSGDDLAARIKAAAGGRGVNVVYDPVGGEVFDASLKATASGARILIIGFAAGSHNTVRTNYALIKSLSILGVRAGEEVRGDRLAQAARWRAMLDLADRGWKPHISQRFPLTEFRAAFESLARRSIIGKVVVEMPRH